MIGPDGARLARLPGHIAYWFAWQGFIDGRRLRGPTGTAAETDAEVVGRPRRDAAL